MNLWQSFLKGLNGLLASRKALVSGVGGAAALLGTKILETGGVHLDPQASPLLILGVTAAYVIAQGLSDNGKEAVIANAKQNALAIVADHMKTSNVNVPYVEGILKLAGFSAEDIASNMGPAWVAHVKLVEKAVGEGEAMLDKDEVVPLQYKMAVSPDPSAGGAEVLHPATPDTLGAKAIGFAR